jgi:hypothetical protein
MPTMTKSGTVNKDELPSTRRLDVSGRSSMSKSDLVEAIKEVNRRETAARR